MLDLPGTFNLQFDNNIHKKGSLGHHSADSNPFPTLLCKEKSTKIKYLITLQDEVLSSSDHTTCGAKTLTHTSEESENEPAFHCF